MPSASPSASSDPTGWERIRRGCRLPATDDAPGGTAIVELGATSGIELLADLRPLDAHTFGLGQAIAAALAAGVSRVVVGLGSSASTDGGTGMLRALGGRFLDAAGEECRSAVRGSRPSPASICQASRRCHPAE